MICCAGRKSAFIRSLSALGCLALAAFFAVACGSSGTGASRPSTDLTNPFLGPDYSGWMAGAASRLATPEEIQAFLALPDDAAAAAFVEQFWARRDPTPNEPGNAILETFERRTAEADRLFSESGYLGRNTDRGRLIVLYGPPTKQDFEVSPHEDVPAVELWTYGPSAPSGLDGKRPASFYRFLKQGELTRLYVPGQLDPTLRRRPSIGRPPSPFDGL